VEIATIRTPCGTYSTAAWTRPSAPRSRPHCNGQKANRRVDPRPIVAHPYWWNRETPFGLNFHQPCLVLFAESVFRAMSAHPKGGKILVVPLESVGVNVTIRPAVKLRSKVTNRPNIRSKANHGVDVSVGRKCIGHSSRVRWWCPSRRIRRDRQSRRRLETVGRWHENVGEDPTTFQHFNSG
jgi:hypothetical protein